VLLAAEAARLAAQLGVTVPELTIPPTEIPLLASKLPDAIGNSTSAVLLKSIAGPIGGLCNSSAFENIGNSSALQHLVSQMKASVNPQMFAMDPTLHFASGLGGGANLGSFPFQKHSGLSLDPLSMATCMKPVYDLSNALLVAARAEVEQMMAQIAAQNASDALPHTPAQPCEQTLPAASLTPLPPPFSTSTLPAITAAASSLSFETSQRTTSSDAAANEGPSTISIFRENIPTAFRSTIRSVCK
jgi:hypothetical protein